MTHVTEHLTLRQLCRPALSTPRPYRMSDLLRWVNVVEFEPIGRTTDRTTLVSEPCNTSFVYPTPHILSLLVRVFVRHIPLYRISSRLASIIIGASPEIRTLHLSLQETGVIPIREAGAKNPVRTDDLALFRG